MQTDIGLLQSRGELTGEAVGVTYADISSSLPERTCYRDEWFSRGRSVDPSRVLVVDRNVSRCAGIAALVRFISQFETRLAHSAEPALAIASDFIPSIVLINTDLPDLACYHLASVLHQRSTLSKVRLIALTAEIASADRRQALAAGFEQYLTLPVQRPSLERVLMPGLVHSRSNERRH